MAGSGNPVPSEEEVDLLENAKILDQLLYSANFTVQGRSTPSQPSGKTLTTWAGLTAGITADNISYDDSASVTGGNTVGAQLDVITAAKSFKLNVSDAMHSWWASPNFLNDGRYAYYAYSGTYGQLKIAIQDMLTGETQSYIVDNDNFNPDDHNTGAIASDGTNVLAMWPGRRNITDNTASYYQSFAAGGKPTVGLTKLSGSSNYPQLYNIDDEFIYFGRITQTASVPQWDYRISAWPFTSFGAQKTLFQSTFTWPYIASRRSLLERKRLCLAQGWHPTNSDSDGSIRYGEIERNVSGDWIFTGATTVNLTTHSAGAALDETDFEIVYTPTGNVRLLGVSDDVIVFLEYTLADGSDGIYKYARKVGGSWSVNDIVATGMPFQVETSTMYHGGTYVAPDIDQVYVTRESGGVWYFELYETADNGATWSLLQSIQANDQEWQDLMIARPQIEDLSDNAWSVDRSNMRVLAVSGRYSEINYDDWNTNVMDFGSLKTELQNFPIYANRLQNRFVTTVSTSTTLKRRWREWTFLITNGSAMTVTIPTDAAENIPIGSRFELIGNGSTVTVQADTGVSLNYTSGGSATFGNRERVILIKVASNSWFIFKDSQVTVS